MKIAPVDSVVPLLHVVKLK